MTCTLGSFAPDRLHRFYDTEGRNGVQQCSRGAPAVRGAQRRSPGGGSGAPAAEVCGRIAAVKHCALRLDVSSRNAVHEWRAAALHPRSTRCEARAAHRPPCTASWDACTVACHAFRCGQVGGRSHCLGLRAWEQRAGAEHDWRAGSERVSKRAHTYAGTPCPLASLPRRSPARPCSAPAWLALLLACAVGQNSESEECESWLRVRERTVLLQCLPVPLTRALASRGTLSARPPGEQL